MFACMLAVYTAFNWVPTMLAGAGLGLSVASNGIAAFNLGGVAGAICGGLIIARIGSADDALNRCWGGLGAVTLALMPITASSNAVPIIAMLGVTGACINALQTTLYALAAHVYPTTVRATGVGTAVAFGRIGGVMSSCAGEWALGAGGTSAFFALMAGSMAVVFVCLALVRRHVPDVNASFHSRPGRSGGSITKRLLISDLRFPRRASRRRPSAEFTPDLARRVDDQRQLGDLILDRQRVAFDGRREPALRAQAQLFERHELRCYRSGA